MEKELSIHKQVEPLISSISTFFKFTQKKKPPQRVAPKVTNSTLKMVVKT